jgi:hypothetical protein
MLEHHTDELGDGAGRSTAGTDTTASGTGEIRLRTDYIAGCTGAPSDCTGASDNELNEP